MNVLKYLYDFTDPIDSCNLYRHGFKNKLENVNPDKILKWVILRNNVEDFNKVATESSMKLNSFYAFSINNPNITVHYKEVDKIGLAKAGIITKDIPYVYSERLYVYSVMNKKKLPDNYTPADFVKTMADNYIILKNCIENNYLDKFKIQIEKIFYFPSWATEDLLDMCIDKKEFIECFTIRNTVVSHLIKNTTYFDLINKKIGGISKFLLLSCICKYKNTYILKKCLKKGYFSQNTILLFVNIHGPEVDLILFSYLE